MEKQAKALMNRFADASILNSKKYQFRVYALEKNKDGVFTNPSIGVSYPSPFNGDYLFVAEVKVYLSPKGGYMLYNHLFTFETMGTLEKELREINEEWAKTLLLPKRIANALCDCYHEVAPHLIDYNEKGNELPEIAQILYKYRGASVALKFGL